MHKIIKWATKYLSDKEMEELLLQRKSFQNYHIHRNPVKKPKNEGFKF